MHDNSLTGQRFFIVTALNILITVAEFLGGIFSGSLALISDAFHNLGDGAAIVMAYAASRISRKKSNQHKTFGYRRAEIISSYLNAIFLIVISVFLIVEAGKRIFEPTKINGILMLIVAIIGLFANAGSALLLNSGKTNNLNIKATYLHFLSDALSSVGVIIGAIVIQLFNITWVDPLVTILVSLYIIKETFPILRDSTNILMQSGPDLDYEAMALDMEKVCGVVSVHHIHAWMIDENRIIFSAHINLQDQMLSNVEVTYQAVEKLLTEKYHVDHVTLQAEVERGRDATKFTTNQNDI
ncbi:cation diffusion facilitator family transporter [Pediococcus claussenii]|uniref:Cobalt/zinc/cadmium cation efflux pump protein n=1 Tax=Pediococcus claussenii (strain ATCC BAA-344 / DSM 14800 / JCM 18046 / KCTC 3811 / LMG 21948 / P06) TaxID=701521 RepID=G8PE74_PEDCP|nr:cation diffusion facilitator family transporter [Pediococcus claussenii]AEV95559.1 Cobalt/zinc/cadmium cation efflux pump protein [Pediococcus claussenii ATCC BAA-344]ANZ69082.1 cobalt transporter [Pediococcus claussenii]ANZ70898.1 cobalt transporter [Pediococcus claussenii]KRN20207.1 czcD protein [Pediococcus claussenii]